MKDLKHLIIGLLITTIATMAFGTDGHVLQLAAGVDNHHAQDHQSGASHDTLADAHSDEAECHAADSFALTTDTSRSDHVVLVSTVRTYAAVENHSIQDPIVFSLREKILLFELANIHTTTLALRV